MRVVFLGTPEWAVPSLDALVASGHEIAGVVSQPDRRSSRRGGAAPPPVVRRARAIGLPVVQPGSAKDPAFLEWFRAQNADAGALVAYGEILSKTLLAVPRSGFVNLHFSLLPRWRGAAPVQWTIASGDTVTGVTTQRVVARLDAGDVLLQRRVDIDPRETAGQLGSRLAEIGASLLVETLDAVEAGRLTPRPQDESAATRAPLLRKEHGAADWSLSAEVLARRVRAFDPWPGVTGTVRGRAVRLIEAEAEAAPGGREGGTVPLETGTVPRARASDLPPGTILGLSGRALRIVCGDGSVLRVARVQFANGKPITGAEAVNGRLVAPGDSFDGDAVDGGEA